ncbi:MAG: response regulator transcription factor [Thiolinea sp.]
MPEFCHSLLIVDDETAICNLLKRYFEKRGAVVHCVGGGEAMHAVLAAQPVDLVLLDVHLPGKDGFVLLDEIKHRYGTAVIMLTARNALQDRVAGLNNGADDYLPKPFDMSELLARARAVLRRMPDSHTSALPDTDCYRFAGYCLDSRVRELRDPQQQLINLSPAEFDLLQILVRHPGTVLSRDYLLQQTRGRDAAPYDRSIDVRMGQLRKKLPVAAEQTLFKTIRGWLYAYSGSAAPALMRIVGFRPCPVPNEPTVHAPLFR